MPRGIALGNATPDYGSNMVGKRKSTALRLFKPRGIRKNLKPRHLFMARPFNRRRHQKK